MICECGWPIHAEGVRATITCPNCKAKVEVGAGAPLKPVSEPAPDPAWVVALKRLRKPEDTGVGDTVQRLASWLGGEYFKLFAARLGIPCGCTARQAEWNERWRY